MFQLLSNLMIVSYKNFKNNILYIFTIINKLIRIQKIVDTNVQFTTIKTFLNLKKTKTCFNNVSILKAVDDFLCVR